MPSLRSSLIRAPRGRVGVRPRLHVLGALAVVALVVAACGSPSAKGKGGNTPVDTQPAVASTRCPLTDEPAPGGVVPARPALAVKIGNEPDGARPQSGLNEADIVYDTPAEGFIMRYVAVFQCQDASSIGPTRSVRWVDWHILRQFIHPILAYANGINPDVDTVNGLKWIESADLLTSAQSAGTRITSRVAPDNLYTSTSALYGLFKSQTTPPAPVFAYTSALPAGASAAASLAINFSEGTNVLWTWNAASGSWIHSYTGPGGGTDIDTLTGKPVTTTNIVVQIVHYTFGPYPESPGGTGDVESQTIGSGPGYILRDGKSIKVTWHRAELVDPMTFTAASGAKVGLAPGRTWVEMVPNTTASSSGALTITH